jgi:hypothetical protein
VPFRYRLFSRAGDDHGTIQLLSSVRIEPGETFHGHAAQLFRVVDVVRFDEEGPLTALLTVEPAASGNEPSRQ